MWQTSQDRHRMSNVVLQVLSVWPGGVLVRALDLRLRRSLVRLPVLRFQITTLGKLFTHVPLSRSSIIWYRSRSGDVLWPGRSGVALAMRHRLQWFIHLPAQRLEREMSIPPTPPVGYGTLYFFSLVLTTTVASLSHCTHVHLCWQRVATSDLPLQNSEIESLGQNSRERYPYFSDTYIFLQQCMG